MIEKFRLFGETIWAKILFGLIAMSFLSWGITGYILQDKANPTVAVIGNSDIDLAMFSKEYNLQAAQIEKVVGNSYKIPADMKKAIASQVLENMKYRVLLDQDAIALGLVMTNEQIWNVVQTQDEFKDFSGKFSYDTYRQIMAYNNVAEKKFFDEIKLQNARAVMTGLFNSAVSIPSIYAKFIYDLENQERIISYQKFDINSMKTDNATDDQLKIVYEQNKHMYATPEYREITYLLIMPEHVKGDKGEALLNKAEEVENEVVSGIDFEEIAKLQKITYGKLPYLTNDMLDKKGKKYTDKTLSKEIIIKAWEVGERSETSLMKHKNGYVILFVNSLQSSSFLPYDAVKDKIKELAINAEKNKLAYLKANEFLKEIKGKKTTLNFDMAVKKTDKNLSEEFLTSIFSQKIGDEFIAKTKDAYMVVQINEIKKPLTNKAETDKIKILLKEQLPDLVMQDYMKYLQEKEGVKFYMKRIDNSL